MCLVWDFILCLTLSPQGLGMCWSLRLLLFTHATCNPSSPDWCSIIRVYGCAREVCNQVGSSYMLSWCCVLALLFLRTLFVLGISDKQSSPLQDYKLHKVWDHICRSRHPGDNNICWLSGWLLSPLGLMLFCDDMGEVKANLNLVRQLWHYVFGPGFACTCRQQHVCCSFSLATCSWR